MKQKDLDTCRLILKLSQDITYFKTSIHENIFLKALSFISKLNNSNLNIDIDSFQSRNILLIHKYGNFIIINKNKLLVKENNIVKIIDDPTLILLSYLIKQLAKDHYEEFKYFIDVYTIE